jgi:hypothetical protein
VVFTAAEGKLTVQVVVALEKIVVSAHWSDKASGLNDSSVCREEPFSEAVTVPV